MPATLIPIAASGGLVVVALCVIAAALGGIGFRISSGWQGWANWAQSEWQNGNHAVVASRVAYALPDKIACGTRWLVSEPQFAYANALERQGRYEQAIGVCQRAAQSTLDCAATSTRYARCWEMDRQMLKQVCLQACDVVTCRAARVYDCRP